RPLTVLAQSRSKAHNGEVHMSVETLTVIISAVSLLLAFFGVIGWLISRLDGQFTRLDAKFEKRIGGVEERLGARIDGVEKRIDGVEKRIEGVEKRIGARIDSVARELVEVKIGLARLEGP